MNHQSDSVVSWDNTLYQRIVDTLNTHAYYLFWPELPDQVLIDFSLTVKAVSSIFICGCCSASLSAKQKKSGSIYNLVKN